MKQNIPDSFVSYLKYYMEKNSFSTRKLSKHINKSTNYISSILLGKIKTIEFKTALKIVEVLNPQINAVELLIDNFGIEPDEVILKRIQEAEESYEKKLEDIKYVDDLTETIGKNLIEDMLKNSVTDKAEIIKKLSGYDFHNNIFYIIEVMFYLQEKYPDEYDLLFLIADELAEFTQFKLSDIQPASEEQKQLRIKIREVLFNGRDTKKKEV